MRKQLTIIAAGLGLAVGGFGLFSVSRRPCRPAELPLFLKSIMSPILSVCRLSVFNTIRMDTPACSPSADMAIMGPAITGAATMGAAIMGAAIMGAGTAVAAITGAGSLVAVIMGAGWAVMAVGVTSAGIADHCSPV